MYMCVCMGVNKYAYNYYEKIGYLPLVADIPRRDGRVYLYGNNG